MSVRTSRLLGLGVLLLLVVSGTICSFLYGARSIPAEDVWAALRDLPATSSSPEEVPVNQRVVAELRLPRTILAIIVGAALGVAGALIQGHTRNPLADPGILGISSGAALSVVASYALLGISAPWATAVVAFLGAIAATALVFGLASAGRATVNPLTLVLGGAALSAVLSAITSAFVLTSENNLDRMRFWTVGSLAGRDMNIALSVLPFVVLGLILAFATGPQLNILNLGDDVAAGLGINTAAARLGGMGIIALLAGAATAAAGPLGFIGLVVPHIVRALTGPDYKWILPYSALAGAALLLYADVVGRLIARPGELQVGIVLAFVGAPFFIVLIYRKKVATL
ncbi:FecCD family ABC transporter permease [Corynebacterium macclintockiae]|jgi:iron complex transport system permease protein|uniref:Iron ABC transporter permease n=2 Tax=Corynebacterium TaxID=1716 RepID=A0ABT1G3V6_9CORY|nr:MULTISPECIES: iron ABC transporter permease [Corynebacterium]MCG7455875.1 iron ABC transporter permease [Corynebacterium sp. ACRPH]MCP1388726.1 iron ABC transporter permease [Corynebacterium stercoris]MCQ4628304.1 iron ABC transporter permease [Corynebacterium sp. CCUG 65737]WKK60499.1 iron ABC transporter permease [Corynebacterium sp. P3-F1]CAI37993.1 putative iron ABC transport system, permease protein [Corynebacterium jeikeium K411]